MTWATGLMLACLLLIAIYVVAELLAQRPSRKWIERVRGLERGRRAMADER